MARLELEDLPRKRPPLFWWFLANILAIGFAIASWVVCLNLFRDPTHPTSYELMLKVGRIDPLESFSPTSAPTPKKVSDPLELEAQFQSITEDELKVLNNELRRSYLTNFNRSRTLTYVTGEFQISEVRALKDDDFLTSGAVIKAQALIRPDKIGDPIPYPVFIECLFPSTDDATRLFNVGDSLVLKKIPDCAAIINVDRTPYEDSSALFLTVVPLCAVDYTAPGGQAIAISPPEKANVAAILPAIP
ncbi:hypothetical protein N9A86_05510 [Akkermansiaceae bacterium]|nr:hypothetical protein [Akkermansiaceae bacterium]MDB4544421.1 hypothetical protein [Akkermansiaceae bacterium]